MFLKVVIPFLNVLLIPLSKYKTLHTPSSHTDIHTQADTDTYTIMHRYTHTGHTHRHRHHHTDRHRHTPSHTQTQTPSHRQTQTHTHRHRHHHTDRHQTNSNTDSHTYRISHSTVTSLLKIFLYKMTTINVERK